MTGIEGVWHRRVQLCSFVMAIVHYTILKTMDKYCSYETWIQPSWSVSYLLKISVNLCGEKKEQKLNAFVTLAELQHSYLHNSPDGTQIWIRFYVRNSFTRVKSAVYCVRFGYL